MFCEGLALPKADVRGPLLPCSDPLTLLFPPLLLAASVAPSLRSRSWSRSNFDCCCAALCDRSRRIDETKVASCASLDLTGPNLILLQGLPDFPQNMRQSTSTLLINHTLAVLSVF